MTDDLQLTGAEREIIRREFMSRFGEAASVTEGFLVKPWATGPNKGRLKLTTAVQGMLDRGLTTIADEVILHLYRLLCEFVSNYSRLCCNIAR